MIMMHNLSDLYHARVGPSHTISPENIRYQSLMEQCGELRELLKKQLTDEDLKILEDLYELQSQIVSIELEINYIEGFRDGAGIMLDVMNGTNHDAS